LSRISHRPRAAKKVSRAGKSIARLTGIGGHQGIRRTTRCPRDLAALELRCLAYLDRRQAAPPDQSWQSQRAS
jgi:hypothetical protein